MKQEYIISFVLFAGPWLTVPSTVQSEAEMVS